MTRLFLGHLVDVPTDPFAGWSEDEARTGPPPGDDALRVVENGAVAVDASGRIVDLGPAATVRSRCPKAEVAAAGGWWLPGLVDAHVHYPQLAVVGVMGLRLLDWLRDRTWPHEARFSDAAFARVEAERFLAALARNGTTSAMVFGAHQATAMEAFFAAADASGLRITSGLVLGDRELPAELTTDAPRALAESHRLIERWHGRGRLRYAVTPRFAVSATDDLLAACGELLRDGPSDLWLTTHLNETPEEIAYVGDAFPQAQDYLDVYDRYGLIGPRSVLAHDVHPRDRELARMARAGAAVCHCPGSNHFIGSGLFPLARHLAAGVRTALGTDVGGGPGFSLLREARLAYETQMLLAADGVRLGAARALWMATGAGARALGLDESVGDLTPGKRADLVHIVPREGSTLAERLDRATDALDAVGALIALAGEADVAGTWVDGRAVHGPRESSAPARAARSDR